ncbi:MAG: PAS domain S-box protein [Candidatus Cloacimonetes bacterium]|nr:PAS domain S-box protein [Candidatus Cloacimonadota bacterium]
MKRPVVSAKFLNFLKKIIPFIVLVSLFVFTIAIANFSKEIERNKSIHNLSRDFAEITRSIRDRIKRYELILKSGSTLFYASDEVTAEEWRLFYNHLKIGADFPEIYSMIFCTDTTNDDSLATIQFQESSQAKFPLINGFNCFSDSIISSVLHVSQERNDVALSALWKAPIDETNKKLFILSCPAKKKSTHSDRENFTDQRIGYVLLFFDPYVMLESLLKDYTGNFHLSIYENSKIANKSLIYSWNNIRSLNGKNSDSYSEEFALFVFNGKWIILYEAFDPGKSYIYLSVLLIGILISFLSFFLIITYQKSIITAQNLTADLAKNMLEKREAYRTLNENSSLLLCRYLPDLTISFVNDSYCRYFEKTKENFIGRSILEFVSVTEREAIKQNISLLTVNSPIRTHEHQTFSIKGEERWHRWIDKAIFDSKGRISFYLSVGEDITELRNSEKKLKLNYSLMQIAGRTARIGGWTIDLTSKIIHWSDIIADIHGMPPGYSPSFNEGINYYAPEWRNRMIEVFTVCSEKGIPYDEEMEIIRADGKRIWVRTVGKAVRDESGNIYQINGAFQDINARKINEIKLEKQLEELLRWQKVSIDREERIIELKKEINHFLQTNGQPIKYLRVETNGGNNV